MRRLILVLGFACLIVSSAMAGQVSTTVYFNPPEITNMGDYDQVIIPGCLTIANPGEPMLPRYGLSLLVPSGEEAVSLEYVYGERIKLEGTYAIEPAQRQYPLGYNGPVEEISPNPDIYNSNNKYPGAIESSFSTQFYRGHGIAFADICPIEYYPQSGELYYYETIEVKVNTQFSEKAQAAYHNFLRIDGSTNSRLSNYIQNKQDITMLYGQSSLDVDDEGNYDFLIITNQDMYDEVLPLAEVKNHAGYLTEIILVSSILNDYTGVDDQEKIRNCIIDQYQNHGIEYVLLVGDDEIIPHRGFYETAGGYENELDVPADIYYSGLDGTWNTDNDSRWGEPGEDDLTGEIYIGRMATDTPTEAANFIAKTIKYQYEPVVDDIGDALMVGEDLGWEVWGKDYKEEIKEGSSSWGYTTEGFPRYGFDVQTLYDQDGVWSPLSQLKNALNNGMHLVNHLGHADVEYMMKLYNNNITDVNFTNDGVTHGYYLIYSQGCYCGAFDNRSSYGNYGQDCITEVWTGLQNGPVAMITNSRYGWGDIDGTNGSSQYFDRQFFDAIFGEQIYRVGEVQHDSKVDNIPYIAFAQNRWCYYCCNLFADPTLDLWTKTPQQITATHDNTFVIGQEQFQVTLTDTVGQAVAGARVGLSVNGDCVGRGVTNEGGELTVELFSEISDPGDMELVINAHNFYTYTTTISIIPPNGPYLTYETYEVDDEVGGNNDGIIDYGEIIELWLTLENVGNEAAQNAYAEITTTSPYLNIVDNIASFGTLDAGEVSQSDDSYTIEISPLCPDDYHPSVTIDVYADNFPEALHQTINLTVHAPITDFIICTIDDSANGNNDHCLDVGESVEFYPLISNSGSCTLRDFTAYLFTNDPNLTIPDGYASGGPINSGEQAELNEPIVVNVSSECPNPHEVSFTLSLNGDNGYYNSMTFTMVVGGMEETFESGENGWIHDVVLEGFVDQWHMSQQRNHTGDGSYSWKCGNTGTGNYSSLLDAGLYSTGIDIGDNCVLKFWQWIDAENSNSYPDYAYDGGIVEISDGGGDTWDQLVPVGGYPYLVRASGSPGPFPAETPIFAGAQDWHEVVFDLSDYAGAFAQFRFRFGSDGGVNREGWFIDDLRITAASLHPCPANLAATRNEANQPVLQWSAPDEGEPVGYYIYRAQASGNYIDPINETPVTGLSFIDEDCVPTQNTYYVITAVYDGFDQSNYSNEVFLPATVVGVEDEKNALPVAYQLLQNYPNPFNPITTVKFNLPEDSHVELTVYDILGRKLETLVNEYMQAGYHHVTWDGSNYASGMYFYRISAGDYNSTRKMLMIK